MKFRSMLMASVAVLCAAVPMTAQADTSSKKIALSNNYAATPAPGDADELGQGHKEAVKAGVVAAADPFTTAEKPGDRTGCSDSEHDPAGL